MHDSLMLQEAEMSSSINARRALPVCHAEKLRAVLGGHLSRRLFSASLSQASHRLQ